MQNPKLVLLTLTLALTANTLCQAQRTMNRQMFIQAEAITAIPDFGGKAIWGRYTPSGFCYAGATLANYSNGEVYSEGTKVADCSYRHLYTNGGYMFRALSTRKRNLNLYIGAGAFIGAETIDPQGALPSYLTPENKTSVLYGILPQVEMEIFPFRRLALTISGSLPYNFTSPFGYYHTDLGIGLKLML